LSRISIRPTSRTHHGHDSQQHNNYNIFFGFSGIEISFGYRLFWGGGAKLIFGRLKTRELKTRRQTLWLKTWDPKFKNRVQRGITLDTFGNLGGNLILGAPAVWAQLKLYFIWPPRNAAENANPHGGKCRFWSRKIAGPVYIHKSFE